MGFDQPCGVWTVANCGNSCFQTDDVSQPRRQHFQTFTKPRREYDAAMSRSCTMVCQKLCVVLYFAISMFVIQQCFRTWGWNCHLDRLIFDWMDTCYFNWWKVRCIMDTQVYLHNPGLHDSFPALLCSCLFGQEAKLAHFRYYPHKLTSISTSFDSSTRWMPVENFKVDLNRQHFG